MLSITAKSPNPPIEWVTAKVASLWTIRLARRPSFLRWAHIFPRMHKYLAILIVGLSWLSMCSAKESRATELLRPLQLMCTDVSSLQSSLTNFGRQVPIDIVNLPSGESCFPSLGFQRVANIKHIHSNDQHVVCYKLWDSTRPEAPVNDGQVFCSIAEAVWPIDKVVASRTGDFVIVIKHKQEGSEEAIATCTEGGKVFVQRTAGEWTRGSVLPIDSPLKPTLPPIRNTSKMDDVIREGCRGVDYE